jgi:hypothetical protein
MNTQFSPTYESLKRLDGWVEQNGWLGFDPFDGLSAPFVRKLTFEIPALRIALQQTVRRLPINIRPLLGITPKHSNQAMGYFASGYLHWYALTGDQRFLDKALYCLADLEKSRCPQFVAYAWGWEFDYQSRGYYEPRGVPTVVWTSFIAHAFLDAYELLLDSHFLDVAYSVCDFILNDLPHHQVGLNSTCISYIPFKLMEIHNANMLAASILARVYKHTGKASLLHLAKQAVTYTVENQRADGAWYYGEGARWRWVDGYHTGFVLDSLYTYQRATGDIQFASQLRRGMDFYRAALFDGPVAKHYDTHTGPIDIQSVAQAIQTFAFIPAQYHGDIAWAEQVALWAIENMQDPSGYFYFRKSGGSINKTPLLHWGQATMLASLALLEHRKQFLREKLMHKNEPEKTMEAIS